MRRHDFLPGTKGVQHTDKQPDALKIKQFKWQAKKDNETRSRIAYR